MKDKIVSEIQRLAAEAGGAPPGSRQFQAITGIKESAWRGIHWARWNDALVEAGFSPNLLPSERRIPDDTMFQHLAEACRHFGTFPTVAELRLYGRSRSDFPNFKTIERRFGGFSQLGAQVASWAAGQPSYQDVVGLLGGTSPLPATAPRRQDGSVYLLQSGAFFKIGRSDDLERRVKEITVALPDKTILVHAISTDDPPGIEAYWHRRFAGSRANGEWFKLTRADVAAFKRRKFQ